MLPLQSPSVTRRVMPMKNSDDTIGNRIRDLPACSDAEGSSAKAN